MSLVSAKPEILAVGKETVKSVKAFLTEYQGSDRPSFKTERFKDALTLLYTLDRMVTDEQGEQEPSNATIATVCQLLRLEAREVRASNYPDSDFHSLISDMKTTFVRESQDLPPHLLQLVIETGYLGTKSEIKDRAGLIESFGELADISPEVVILLAEIFSTYHTEMDSK